MLFLRDRKILDIEHSRINRSYEKLLKANARVSRKDEVQKLITVLADEWFSMMAGYIVPLDAVVVEVVQD